MKIKSKKIKVGIVVEYNPFHNGHIYQLNWIKEHFPNSKIIIAMSEKYSQRGEVICLPFWKRVWYSRKYGVNKAVKLPVQISAQAAHIFASEAVLKLAKQKIDYLVFGSETGDASLFIKIAKLIKNNKDQYNTLIKKYLKEKGNSFPRATNLALQELSGENIDMPNDILGLEYVKTIVENNLPITPIAIQRTIGFHSDNPENNFASATYLRKLIKEQKDISKYTPVKIKKLSKRRQIELTYPKFQKLIKSLTPEKIREFKMISEGMENLFIKNIDKPNYDSFIDACVSKRYTASRIKRTYLFVLLQIKKDS